jgi:hypothetical protein
MTKKESKIEHSVYQKENTETVKSAHEVVNNPDKTLQLITEEDWSKMQEQLNEWRGDNDWASFLDKAKNVKILFPERFSQLRINKDDWKGMKSCLANYSADGKWDDVRHVAMCMKILYPDKESQLYIPSEFWDESLEKLKKQRKNNWTFFASIASDMKVLFYDKDCPNIEMGNYRYMLNKNIDDESWEGMQNDLKKLREKKWWSNFAGLAANMKILCPEKVSQLDIDDEAWKGMGKSLEEYHNDMWVAGVFEEVVNMKILEADKDKVIDGLIIQDAF